MSRYTKYFLQNILWLNDGFCQFYVQDRTWCHQEIIDVQALVYDHENDAEQMLWACVEHDPAFSIGQLRGFLAQDCLGHYFVHKMADHEVVQAAARELTEMPYQVVIEPGLGWAVQVDGITQGPVVPIRVEPEPELAPVFAQLKQHLDALVAEQQKKFDQYEAELAKLSETEQAALYGKKAGTGVFGMFSDMVEMLKAFPGFYIGYLKTLRKIALAPSQLAAVTVESIATGSMGPLQAEIDKVVNPLAKGYDEALRFRSILHVLLTDAQTLEILNDFAHRYYAATHPLELTEMGASAASDIVVTILLAIFTAGVGAAANVAAKSTRLAKVAKLLEKLATMLKRVGHRHRLPKKHIPGADTAKTAKRKSSKVKKGGMPEPEKSKGSKKVDKASKNVDDVDGKDAGPKKTHKIKTRKDFKSPEEAYKHVRNLDGDIAKIKKLDLKVSKAENIMTKKKVREWFPEDEYPGIDYSKIDKKLDQYAGKAFDEKELKGVKDYLFDNPRFNPPKNAADELNGPFYDNAESWIRLAEGRGNHADDILIKHEILETRLKYDMDLEKMGQKLGKKWFETHGDCHGVAEEIFNYSETIKGIK